MFRLGLLVAVLSVTLLFAAARPGNAQQPAATQPAATPPDASSPLPVPPPPVPPPPVAPQPAAEKIVTFEQVAQVDDLMRRLIDARDNVYLRDELAGQLRQMADSLIGSQLDVRVFVQRVTADEVLVETRRDGRTRFVLLHAQPPLLGNLGTIDYVGALERPTFHIFAEPIGLRIGSEIPLELARRLRHADLLIVRGRITAVPLVTDRGAFHPWGAAILTDWKVIDVTRD